MNKNLKIIFMGTGTFAVPVLNSLNQNFKVISCFTKIDKPSGRGNKIQACPIKLKSSELNLPTCQPLSFKKETHWIDQLKELNPDIIIVTDYNLMITKEILNIPKYGVLNVHPSLLPLWRGPSPIESSIHNGDKTTGVTIMLLDEQMDHGPILAQQEIQIQQDDTSLTLYQKLSKIGADLLVKTINEYVDNKIKPQEQNHTKATFSKMIEKQDGLIDWNKTAEQINNQIRAFICWPGSFSKTKINEQEKQFKILKAQVLNANSNKKPGELFVTENKKLAIKCGQQSLEILELQLEGKSPMKAQDFINGYLKNA